MLTDEKLFQLCKQYGTNALTWRNKFIGLLPEVHRRRLYEKKGYDSIFEFAAKLAGISQEQVRRALNLEEKFANLPILKSAFNSGEISVNKLARIASIANAQNQEQLATQAKLLSNRALETFVLDTKLENQNGLFETKIDQKSVHMHTAQLQLPADIQQKLLDLQAKGIDIGELLREFLDEREQKIQQEKEEIAATIQSTPKRYIPVKIRKIIGQEFGTKCAIAHCQKPSSQIHHTARHSLIQNHNPHFIAPLCTEHHQIAHTIDLKYHEKRRT